MKTLLAALAFVLTLVTSVHAVSPNVYKYRITADGSYPTNGETVYPRNFFGCSINTRYDTGTANLNVKLKNSDVAFVTLQGGPIQSTDWRTMPTPFSSFQLVVDSCSSCDLTVAVICGVQ